MTIFDHSKSFVENLNFISGPIIALFGLVAIFQLRISKKAMVMTSRRQAAELATEQIKIYVDKIIPLQNKLFISQVKNDFKDINVENIHNFTYEELKKNTSIENIKTKREEYFKTLSQVGDLLNLMESFAIYFTKGIADEEIAFSSIGSTFCNSVKGLKFELCLIRTESELTGFENIVKLYQIWNPKIISYRINQELIKKKQELNNLTIGTVDILGTK